MRMLVKQKESLNDYIDSKGGATVMSPVPRGRYRASKISVSISLDLLGMYNIVLE